MVPLSARPGSFRDRRGSGANKEQIAKESVQTKATCWRGNSRVDSSSRSTVHRGHRQSAGPVPKCLSCIQALVVSSGSARALQPCLDPVGELARKIGGHPLGSRPEEDAWLRLLRRRAETSSHLTVTIRSPPASDLRKLSSSCALRAESVIIPKATQLSEWRSRRLRLPENLDLPLLRDYGLVLR